MIKEAREKKKEELINEELKQCHHDITASRATKFVILEKLLNDFEACMENFYNSNRDFELSFDEFASLITGIGFLKIPYDPKYKENFELKRGEKAKKNKKLEQVDCESLEIRTKMYRRKKEYFSLKNAWQFLRKDVPEAEKVNSIQVILFCACVMGLYDGNDLLSDKSTVMSPLSMNKEDPNDNNLMVKTEETNQGGVNMEDNKQGGVDSDSAAPQKSALHKGSEKKVKNITIDPKVRIDSQPSDRSGLGAIGSLTSINNKNTTRTQISTYSQMTINARARRHKVLLKTVMPEFDLNKYSCPSSDVKHIHNEFRPFYVNRVDYCLKKRSEEEYRRSRSANRENTSFSFSLGHKSNLSAQHWRERRTNVRSS